MNCFEALAAAALEQNCGKLYRTKIVADAASIVISRLVMFVLSGVLCARAICNALNRSARCVSTKLEPC